MNFRPDPIASIGNGENLLNVCKRIEKYKEDYYIVLGVNKNMTGNEIRTVYKKLALRMHSDKNQKEELNDDEKKRVLGAFQIVTVAAKCLTDSSKRAGYDLKGPKGCEI